MFHSSIAMLYLEENDFDPIQVSRGSETRNNYRTVKSERLKRVLLTYLQHFQCNVVLR